MDITVTLRLDLSPALQGTLAGLIGALGRASAPVASHPISAASSDRASRYRSSRHCVGPFAAPRIKVTAQALDELREVWTKQAAKIEDAADLPVLPPEAAGKRWTPERLAILDDAYPRGIVRPAILRAINAQPGAAVSMGQMGACATKRGLRRPTDQRPQVAPEPPVVPEPPAATEPPAPVAAPVPSVLSSPAQLATADEQVADDATIRHWAAQRGVCNGGEPLDLERVNAKRAQFGLPRFARRNGLTASAGTLRPGAP